MEFSEKKNQGWQKKIYQLNRSFHRDIGYFCVGLILVYAVSGIAVNHIESWNPSYVVTRYDRELKDLMPAVESKDFKDVLAKRLGIVGSFRSMVQDGADEYLFFYEDTRVSWNQDLLRASVEITEKRPGLYFANFLHLNKAKRLWTLIADVFAVLLIYLSLSGLFMIRGAHGFARRGWFFVAVGFAIPLGAYWIYI